MIDRPVAITASGLETTPISRVIRAKQPRLGAVRGINQCISPTPTGPNPQAGSIARRYSSVSHPGPAPNSLLSRVKTALNSPVISEKTQRLEVIQGGNRY